MGADQTVQHQAQQLDEWRRSAQRVQRAWDAWLAADRSDHARAYGAFVDALAEEEHAAAEVERMAGCSIPDPRSGQEHPSHDLLPPPAPLPFE